MGTVLKLKPAAARLECSACGAMANASCDCGAPYVPAAQRAAAAIAANPEKSDRAIAMDVGVDRETVARARNKTPGGMPPPEKRIGKDGKSYPAKVQKPKASLKTETNAFHRELFDFSKSFQSRLTLWFQDHPDLDKEAKDTLLRALLLCADELNHLAQRLDGR